MSLQVLVLDDRAVVPFRAYSDDAGLDLHVLEDTWVPSGAGVDVRTGIAVAMEPGSYGRVVGRSSAFRKKGLIVLEGIIDAGFRGELFAFAFCPGGQRGRTIYPSRWAGRGEAGVQLRAGESIAQLIVSPVNIPEVRLVSSLPEHERGEKGFGSSGR